MRSGVRLRGGTRSRSGSFSGGSERDNKGESRNENKNRCMYTLAFCHGQSSVQPSRHFAINHEKRGAAKGALSAQPEAPSYKHHGSVSSSLFLHPAPCVLALPLLLCHMHHVQCLSQREPQETIACCPYRHPTDLLLLSCCSLSLVPYQCVCSMRGLPYNDSFPSSLFL